MPEVAILVVNYFTASDVAELFRSIVAIGDTDRFIVSLVDNSCDREEACRLRVIAADTELVVRLTVAPRNIGYGAGNNLAWDSVSDCDPSVVIVINPDCRVLSLSSAALAAVGQCEEHRLWSARTLDGDGAVSGISRIHRLTGKSVHVNLDDTAKPLRRGIPRWDWTRYPGGHFIALSARTWYALNGFDPAYFLYCEEVDLALRARALGSFSLGTLPDVLVSHAGGSSTGGRAARKSEVVALHANRSRVILYRRQPRLRRWLFPMVVVRLVRSWWEGLSGHRQTARMVRQGLWEGMKVSNE